MPKLTPELAVDHVELDRTTWLVQVHFTDGSVVSMTSGQHNAVATYWTKE